MRTELTDEQDAFRTTAVKFLEAQSPLSEVRRLYDSSDGFDRDWWKAAAELGWSAMFVPETLGGGSVSGGASVDAVIIAEEMGRLVAPGPFLPVNVVAAALAADRGETQWADVLTGLATGDTIATWAIGEQDSLWDGSGLTTSIRRDGSEVVVDGEKLYVEAAAVADHFLVTGMSESGLTQVMIPADAAGVSVRRTRSIDMTRRYGAVTFESVRVAADRVVGEFGGAQAAVDRQLSIAIALQSAEMTGMADRVLEFTLEYGANRFAFGRPIVAYQAIKHNVADLAVRLECSKAVSDALAVALDSGDPDARMLASVAKAYVAEMCLTMVDECVQITGGIGVTWEHDLHLYNRRSALNHALFGTPEEHKRAIIATLREEAAQDGN